jgi:hypothetical protein
MSALTTTAANKLLDHLNGTASYTPTGPLKLRLVTALGTATSAGTEVTGGSYSSKTITFNAASSGSAASAADITFSAMPAVTVVGVEIWDSAGTPVRLWYGALTANRTLASGDDLKFPAGSVIVSAS